MTVGGHAAVGTGVGLVALVVCWLSCGCSPGGLRKETVLSVRLNRPIVHHNCSGQTVELAFDPEHQEQLEEAARRVFRVPSHPLVSSQTKAATAAADVFDL